VASLLELECWRQFTRYSA